MPDVRITHRDFLPEHTENPDLDGADVWSEDFTVNGCDEAAGVLLDHGLTEINGPDDYYDPDGSVLLSSSTGERSETHGRLHGFSPKHERRVADLIRRRVRGER